MFPLVVLEKVVLAKVDVVHTSSTILFFQVTLEERPVRIFLVVLLLVKHCFWNRCLASDAAQRLGNVDSAKQFTKTTGRLAGAVGTSLELLGVASSNQAVADRVSHSHDTFEGVAGKL